MSPLHLDRQWTLAEMATAVEKVCAELRRRLAENTEYDGPMVKHASLHLAMGSAEDLDADLDALKSDRVWDLDDSEHVRLANLRAGPPPKTGEVVRVGYDRAVEGHAANSEEEG